MAIDFSTMDGYEFEDYISSLFRRLGFEVEATNYSNDGGVDLVAIFNQPIFSGKYIIQCKNWTGPVGQPEVRDLYGVVMDQRANKGILITPSDYTQQAYDFANGKNIELINGPILRGLLTTDSEHSKASTPLKPNDAFKNERYSYYQKAISEEPYNVTNYLQMIEYLRSYVKDQASDVCSEELFNDIIDWSDKLINRCFKTASKANDKVMATMFKVEALIHTGRLAEATESLLKCDNFWIYGFYVDMHNVYNDSVKIRWGGSLLAWNLFVAFKHINYVRGCNLLISKLRGTDIFSGRIRVNDDYRVSFTISMMEGLFVYPTPEMSTNGSGKTKHLDMSVFYPKDRKDPTFFYERFYNKTAEQYAQEIDAVFKLHGII